MSLPDKSLKHLIVDETDRAVGAETQLTTDISAAVQATEQVAADLSTAIQTTTVSILAIEANAQQLSLDIQNEQNRAVSAEGALSTELSGISSVVSVNEANSMFCETFEFDGQIQPNTYPFSMGAGLQDSGTNFGLLVPFRYKIVGFSAQAKNSVPDSLPTVMIKLGVECRSTSGTELGELEYHLSRSDAGLVYYLLDSSQTLEVDAGILSLGVREMYEGGDQVPTVGDQFSKYRVSVFIKRVSESV